MIREISASKLCKARLCGKWVNPSGTGKGSKGTSMNTTEAILDGNLRHALMEFYITNYVKERLRLSRLDFEEMMSETKIGFLFDFLREDEEKYPSDYRIKSRRMASKLAGVIAYLDANLSQKFGDLILAEAELNIGGLDIVLSDSFVLNRGEIDAVFIYAKPDRQRIVVVDWKRTIDETSRAYYEAQLYTYARCLIKNPNLVELPNIDKKDFCLLLVEVGGDEEMRPKLVPFPYKPEELELILAETSRNLETLEPRVGNHCSSRCPHAFHREKPCLAFDSMGRYEPNLTSEDFWINRRFSDNGHYSMVQVKVTEHAYLQRSKLNSVRFSLNGDVKTINLKNTEHEFVIEPHDEIRIEGHIQRVSRNDVEIYCTNMLRI